MYFKILQNLAMLNMYGLNQIQERLLLPNNKIKVKVEQNIHGMFRIWFLSNGKQHAEKQIKIKKT